MPVSITSTVKRRIFQRIMPTECPHLNRKSEMTSTAYIYVIHKTLSFFEFYWFKQKKNGRTEENTLFVSVFLFYNQYSNVISLSVYHCSTLPEKRLKLLSGAYEQAQLARIHI